MAQSLQPRLGLAHSTERMLLGGKAGYLDVRSAREPAWRKHWFHLSASGLDEFDCPPVVTAGAMTRGTRIRHITVDSFRGIATGASSITAAARSAQRTHPHADPIEAAVAATAVPILQADDEPSADESGRIFLLRIVGGAMELRAASNDEANDWLFGFHKLIAHILSGVLQRAEDQLNARQGGASGAWRGWHRGLAPRGASGGAVLTGGASHGQPRDRISNAGDLITDVTAGRLPLDPIDSSAASTMMPVNSGGTTGLVHVRSNPAISAGNSSTAAVAGGLLNPPSLPVPLGGGDSASIPLDIGAGDSRRATDATTPLRDHHHHHGGAGGAGAGGGWGGQTAASLPHWNRGIGAMASMPAHTGLRLGAADASLDLSNGGTDRGAVLANRLGVGADKSQASQATAGLFEEEESDDEGSAAATAVTPASGLATAGLSRALTQTQPPAVLPSIAAGASSSEVESGETLTKREDYDTDWAKTHAAMLRLEQRAEGGAPIFPAKLAKLREWQQEHGRALTEIPSKPAPSSDDRGLSGDRPLLARGFSAPEAYTPFTSSSGTHRIGVDHPTRRLGRNWSNGISGFESPVSVTGTSASHVAAGIASGDGTVIIASAPDAATAAFDEAVTGAFGGEGSGQGAWGVWGCQGQREGMDDEHVALPALEELATVIASDSHLSDSTSSQHADDVDHVDDDGIVVASPGNRLLAAVSSAEPTVSSSRVGSTTPLDHGKISLYCVFDGHAGNAASAFAAKDLPARLQPTLEAVLLEHTGTDADAAAGVGSAISESFAASDAEFFRRVDAIKKDQTMASTLLAGTGGCGAGTTAIVVAIDWATSRLIVAGAGDCRAVIAHQPRATITATTSDSTAGGTTAATATATASAATSVVASASRIPGSLWLGHPAARSSTPSHQQPVTVAEALDNSMIPLTEWPEALRHVMGWDLLPLHSPAGVEESKRIEAVGGWVTHEHEILIPDLKVSDEAFEDPFIRARLRMLATLALTNPLRLDIHRVCGELGVSRAIGDVDYKDPRMNNWDFAWKFAPGGTKRAFTGDLVSCMPDVRVMPLDSTVEALVIACDGLWDVIAPIDAARAAAEVLRAKAPPKVAARRLAEAAIRLGSTDNVTVLVVDLRGYFE